MAKRKQSVQLDPEINHAMIPRTSAPQLCAQAYRHYRAQVRSVLDSNSSDGPDHEAKSPKRRRQMKLKDRDVYFHQRKTASAKTYTDSSKISQAQIQKYLDVDLRNCPKFANIGEQLQGGTPNEIVQDLLDDMKTKQFPFPVKTYDCLVRDTIGSMPESIRESVEQKVITLQSILETVDFKEDNCKELVESYREIHLVVSREWHHRIFDPKSEVLASHILDPLQLFLKSILAQEDSGKIDQTPHFHLVNFWKGLLLKMRCPMNEGEGNVLFNVRTNGTGKNLPVQLRGRSDDVPTVMVNTKADILCETILCATEPKALPVGVRKQNALLRTLAVEVKTTNLRRGLKAKGTASLEQIAYRSASDSASKHDSGSHTSGKVQRHETAGKSKQSNSNKQYMTKSSHDGQPQGTNESSDEDEESESEATSRDKDPTWSHGSGAKSPKLHPMDPRLGSLTTQHFMELLSMMTADDEEGGVVSQAHGIGLYIVMHRVYVTGLFAVGDDLPYFMRATAAKTAAQQRRQQRYRMICCKYFNIFKRGHLTALMDFIEYLLFHQYKVMDKF